MPQGSTTTPGGSGGSDDRAVIFDTSALGATDIVPPTKEQIAQLNAGEAALCDWICSIVYRKLATSKTYPNLPRVEFSEDSRQILLDAWKLAWQLQSRRVLVEHFLVALLTAPAGSGYLQDKPEKRLALLTGAFVRMTNFNSGYAIGPQGRDAKVPRPALVNWIAEAIKLADSHGSCAVKAEDFVAVFSGMETDRDALLYDEDLEEADAGGSDQEVRKRLVAHFGFLKTIGHSRSQIDLTRQRAESAYKVVKQQENATKASFAAVTQSLDSIDGGVQRLATQISENSAFDASERQALKGDVTQLVETRLAALDGKVIELSTTHLPRLAAAIATARPEAAPDGAQLEAIADSVRDCQNLVADLSRKATEITHPGLARISDAVGESRSQLTQIDRRTVAIEARLPKPPTTSWLALAAASVILVGIVTGWLLSQPPASSPTNPASKARVETGGAGDSG